jgi:DNA end-binding protein Ku
MAPRAIWKGRLKGGEFTCPVALYSAVSTAERITFHILNRKTGHRVHREFVDSETGRPVAARDQIKGYEIGKSEYVELEPEEIAQTLPETDKTLSIQAFIRCEAVDAIYFDRPYYLAPDKPTGSERYALLRDTMRSAKVAAIARGILFRRVRSVPIRPQDEGMIATTLNFAYEVRSATEAFTEIPAIKAEDEMLDLALHIIKTKAGRFEPKSFDDRYDQALRDLVEAKIEGRKIAPPKPLAATKPVGLMEALRQSAKQGGRDRKASSHRNSPRRKAG